MTRPRILVTGVGVAGLTAAQLLARRGCSVTVVDAGARPAPAVVLNSVTISLLEEVWGGDGMLLAGAHQLTGRRVRWGGAGVETAAQPGVSMDSGVLARRLRERLVCDLVTGGPPGCERAAGDWDWVIDADRTGDGLAAGRRCVLAAQVRLRPDVPDVPDGLCRMETVPDAWIHLAPLGAGLATVQAMVPTCPDDPAALLAALVARTDELGGLITEPDGPVTVFEAAPRLAEPRCGPGWLAVGDRAMKLDPLSGSGAASAVRQAILAAAVVGAPSAGVPVAEALAHYARRLHDAFLDHLAHCLRYYGAAFSIPAWRPSWTRCDGCCVRRRNSR
jgi:flavin-dependent dehydrogenase